MECLNSVQDLGCSVGLPNRRVRDSRSPWISNRHSVASRSKELPSGTFHSFRLLSFPQHSLITQGILPHPTTCTVHTFLHPNPNSETPGSLLTLTAQACILLHQVTYFAGQTNLGKSRVKIKFTSFSLIILFVLGRNMQSFSSSFQLLERLIISVRHRLPDLSDLPRQSPFNGNVSIFFVHALLYASTIKLHELLVSNQPASRQECGVAARSMISWASSILQDSTCTNPIMGVSTFLFLLAFHCSDLDMLIALTFYCRRS